MNMQISVAAGLFAVLCYLTGTVLQFRAMGATDSARDGRDKAVLLAGAAAVAAHGLSAWGVLHGADGYRFGIAQISTSLTAAVSLLLLISSLRRPLSALFLGLFPLAAAAILVSLLLESDYPATRLGPGLAGHVLISMLAYSLFTIAALQALFLAYQNRRLKTTYSGSGGVTGGMASSAAKGIADRMMARLPALEDMEALLFELLWAGQLLLSLGILAGFLFGGDLWSHAGVIHKTFFSLLAWLVFAALLWGRHQAGWRGPTAVRYTLTGFALLLLGFYGSKFVLEYIFG